MILLIFAGYARGVQSGSRSDSSGAWTSYRLRLHRSHVALAPTRSGWASPFISSTVFTVLRGGAVGPPAAGTRCWRGSALGAAAALRRTRTSVVRPAIQHQLLCEVDTLLEGIKPRYEQVQEVA